MDRLEKRYFENENGDTNTNDINIANTRRQLRINENILQRDRYAADLDCQIVLLYLVAESVSPIFEVCKFVFEKIMR